MPSSPESYLRRTIQAMSGNVGIEEKKRRRTVHIRVHLSSAMFLKSVQFIIRIDGGKHSVWLNVTGTTTIQKNQLVGLACESIGIGKCACCRDGTYSTIRFGSVSRCSSRLWQWKDTHSTNDKPTQVDVDVKMSGAWTGTSAGRRIKRWPSHTYCWDFAVTKIVF